MQHTDLPLLDPLGRVDLLHRDVRGWSAIEGQAVPEGDEGRRIRVRRGDRGERGMQHGRLSRLLSVDGVERVQRQLWRRRQEPRATL